MKRKLFNVGLWLMMVLFTIHVNAQADPTLTEVNTSTNDVTITNLGDMDLDISSYWVCLGPGQYRQLSALSIVEGDYMLSADEAVTFDFPLITGENADGAGGLGLFSTNSFGSTNSSIYVDFMQWGGPNQDRASQAVTAGIWDNAANFVGGASPYTTAIGGSAAVWMGAPTPVEFTAILSGVQENPAAFTTATGTVNATLTGNELVVSGSFEGLRGELYTPAAGGDHIHRALAGRNGGIELSLTAVLSDGNTAGVYNAVDNTFTLTDDQVTALNAREFYVNIHSSVFTGGELRGQILPSSDDYYQATLLGSNEVPSINTTAGGNLLFELEGDQLAVSGSFDDLSSEIRIDLANGAHIHNAFAGRNGAVIFPLNPTYDVDNQGATIEAANNTFTLNAEQLAQIEEQGMYINIHSVNFPAGELRGQILPVSTAVLRAELSGFQEVPSISSEADGRIYVSYNGEGSFSVGGTFNNLSGDLFLPAAGGIHLHMGNAGILGPVEFIITPEVAADNRNAIIRPSENTFVIENDEQLAALLSRSANRGFYINVHSETFQSGELRGQILPLAQSYFGANLSGQNEVPQPVISTGVGNIELELTGDQLTVTGGFSNLSSDYDSSPAVAGGAHLHLGDAASTGGVDIILNTTVDTDLRGGVFIPAQNTFTVTPTQIQALLDGGFYVNIHTIANGAGEIRGQVLRDDNAFPLATAITSPANGNVNLVDDSATPYVVTWDATTDPDGDLVVYAYQLATDAAFTDLLINTSVGTALEYNVENSVVFNAIAGAPVNALLYQRVLASDGSVSTPSAAQTTTLNCIADGGTVSIDLEATGNPNGTTSFNGDTEAVICLDSQADPIVVIHENPGAEDLSYRYVITDAATGLILNVVNTNSIDLNGVEAGVCEIWGWSYRGVPGNGLDQIGEPLSALDDLDCSDISDNAVTIIRQEANGGTVSIDLEATGNPNGTTSFNGDTEAVICLDSQMDPIVVVHENPGSEELSYRYVITDAETGLILNVVATNSIDLNGVAAGVCEIWGWSYRGVPGNGLDQVGEPLSALDDLDCSDISDNAVTVIREAADGGTVSIDLEATGNPNGTTTFNGDTEAVICLDSQADPIVVVHENDSPNLSYRYVITDAETGLILNVVNTNSIDLNGVAAGVCEIWGWSYRNVPGNGLDQVGEPLSALDDLDCSDISDNAVTVIREAADGGTVSIDLEATGNPNGTTSFNGDTEAVICLDSQADPIVVVHENDSPNLSYRYVITDAETGLILNVVNTNSIDLNGVAAGVCEIWGWSYRGVPGNGLDQVGEPLSALDDLDCSDISDNAVTVIREAADGGTVSIDLEATGNPNGTTTFNGDTEAVICLDSQMDPIVVVHENDSPNLSYRYVITDAATGLILNVVNTNSIDLNGVAAGVCEIWGWSYRNVPGNGLDQIGEPLSSLDDLDCSDISDNAVTVIREAADGGTVSIDLEATGNPNGTTTFNGDTEAVICLDSQMDPIVVVHENDSPNLSYRYVITDAETGLILNVVNTNSIDLNGVAAGVCEIWGWSYRNVPGNGLDQVGEPLSALDDLDCSDISDNAVTVIREAADADSTISIDLEATGNPNGTTTFEDDFVAIICGDTQADPLVINVETTGSELPYYLLVFNFETSLIEDVILTTDNSGVVDLNGITNSEFEIFGLSGVLPNDGLDIIGQEFDAIFEFVDSGCLALSLNSVFVLREVADGGTVAIDLDATGNPNGTTTFNGDTEAVICVDGQMDPIVVVHENDSPNLSYRYVITDAATGLILNVVNTNSISLDPAGPGTCEIWGWSYRGVPGNGLDQIGEPLSALDDLDCSDISDNAITVIRETADGGTVAIDLDATGNPNGTTTFNGDTEAVICVDGQMDPIVVVHENDSPNLSYRYVITDAATGLILNVVNTNSISLDPAGPGTCEIWGWSYRGVPGNGLDQIGEPLSALDDLDCSDISDNAITVIRETADGGTVSIDIDATDAIGENTTIVTGDNAVTILVGDGIANPIVVQHENESPNLSYRYVITDADTGLILNVVNTDTIDLEGAGLGTCEIWGWSYRGVPGNGLDQIGEPLSALDDLDCSDISDDFIEVIRTDVLAVEDNQISLELSMYPNPTTSFLNISLGGVNNGYAVNVYSVTGQIVMSETYSAQDNTLDVSRLSDGMYLLEVIDETSNTRTVKRFIKR
ncbi:CHRD domain-containing protein [uncultured Dokdonia sp.]|uniref:CHRD domain-containing protein n=1 Tax=uncultured Dokdonia sp. TaxID=575653 RepID=UPI002609517C|nr:CHRD domain-containing protein [uncultured Dokdonia sp.]